MNEFTKLQDLYRWVILEKEKLDIIFKMLPDFYKPKCEHDWRPKEAKQSNSMGAVSQGLSNVKCSKCNKEID